MREKLHEKKWYPYAVAACIAVVVYVALTHLDTVFDVAATFLGFFSAPFLGCVIAYLLNPLAMFFHRTVFKDMRKPDLRWLASIVLAVLALVLFLALILSTLVPQLVESITMLATNMDGYIAALVQLSHTWGIAEYINLDEFMGTSGNLMSNLLKIAGDNMQDILNVSVTAGKGLMMWGLAFMLSVYLLASKESLKSGAKRFLQALLPEKRYQVAMGFLTRCNGILQRYIVFSILDAVIIGGANAVFMACTGMQYVGLISLVVAVTNLGRPPDAGRLRDQTQAVRGLVGRLRPVDPRLHHRVREHVGHRRDSARHSAGRHHRLHLQGCDHAASRRAQAQARFRISRAIAGVTPRMLREMRHRSRGAVSHAVAIPRAAGRPSAPRDATAPRR